MFERFTDRARRVVVLAQEEAKMLKHNYIGTEHELLGLIREAEGVAAKVLLGLGVSLDQVRDAVEKKIGIGRFEPTRHIPFTLRAKMVLELALREALHLGHNYIGTEHILLAILREGKGIAAQVLTETFRLELGAIRSAVLAQLGIDEPARSTAVSEDEAPGAPAVSFGILADNQVIITIDDPSGVVEITNISVAFRDSNGNRCHAKWPADD